MGSIGKILALDFGHSSLNMVGVGNDRNILGISGQ
jgi:hypothetical protein